MIDLHIHTTHSDGSLTVPELLKLAEQKGLEVIAITDHNSVGAYAELENKDVRKLFGGKIIPGVEIHAMCGNHVIEVLGYNINTTKMKSILDKNLPHDIDSFFISKISAKLSELGLDIERKSFPKLIDLQLLVFNKHKAFIEKFGDPRLTENLRALNAFGFANKASKLYSGIDDCYKSIEEVVSWIHACGGKAFLAHPAEYYDNAAEILETTKKTFDGIECFHYSMNKQYSDKLVTFCRANNLLISGGSDFHGKAKPTVELGIGTCHPKIPRELITWL